MEDIESLWKFGVEIECGASSDLAHDRSMLPPIYSPVTDNSMSCSEGYGKEYISRPMLMEEIEMFINQTEELYDMIVEMNSTMGLHIHVSANTEEGYSMDLIKSFRFYEYFMDIVKSSDLYQDSERFQERMDDCRWCHPMDEDVLAANVDRNEERYQRINYRPLRHQGTVEFRLFPAMDTAEEVVRAVKLTCNAIDSWIQDEKYEFTSETSCSSEKGEKVVTV